MIDLKARLGRRYRVYHDPSWDAETPDVRTAARKSGYEAWYYELRGPNVIVYPLSSTTVGVRWLGRGHKALLRASLSHRRLDGEVVYIIAFKGLEDALGNVRMDKCRPVTNAQRARGKALAAKYGFRPPKCS